MSLLFAHPSVLFVNDVLIKMRRFYCAVAYRIVSVNTIV